MIGLSPEETAATGAGITGVIMAAIAWLRSVGSRITKLENRMDKITSIEESPFVLHKDFEKACLEIKGDIKGLRTVTSDGFESIRTCLTELECARRVNEDRVKREKEGK
jgi:uncharacterized protein YsxB (DUF464 family)